VNLDQLFDPLNSKQCLIDRVAHVSTLDTSQRLDSLDFCSWEKRYKVGLSSLLVRLQYLMCVASCLYRLGFEPGTRVGYLVCISCIYALILISQADTDGSPVSSLIGDWRLLPWIRVHGIVCAVVLSTETDRDYRNKWFAWHTTFC